MSKIVRKELALDGKVPQEVKDRVCASLDGRGIDFSDLPELTDWLVPPTIIKVSLDVETAKSLRDKAAETHRTPAQTVSEMVKKELRSA